MGQARQRLLGRVRVDRTQAAQMTGIEGLKQIERFRPPNLADDDAIGPMSQRRPQEIRNRHRWKRLLPSEWRLRAPSFESHEVGFLQVDLRGLLDDDNAVVVR